VGAKLFHAEEKTDRQTDVTKLIIAFRNVAKSALKEPTDFLWAPEDIWWRKLQENLGTTTLEK
jgi:hypothetical protein